MEDETSRAGARRQAISLLGVFVDDLARRTLCISVEFPCALTSLAASAFALGLLGFPWVTGGKRAALLAKSYSRSRYLFNAQANPFLRTSEFRDLHISTYSIVAINARGGGPTNCQKKPSTIAVQISALRLYFGPIFQPWRLGTQDDLGAL